MNRPAADSRTCAIVLGCGDIGSAIAVALHAAGLAVVLVDEADPAWHRRGMAFTNAWYLGSAELEGEGACFCASTKSIPSVLARMMIAATTWSWPSVAAVLAPVVVVDARARVRPGTSVLCGRVPLAIGVGPQHVEGTSVDVAIALPGAGVGGAHAHDGLACVRLAELPGRFATDRRIGERVHAGQIVGALWRSEIVAPAAGVLVGLAARGARIEIGDPLVEVDPDAGPWACYGVREGPRRVAEAVLAALTSRGVVAPRQGVIELSQSATTMSG